MQTHTDHSFLETATERLRAEFGNPDRAIDKVVAWHFAPGLSVVLQRDQPANGGYALLWLPYPPEGGLVPEIAVEYPAEAGRHSNTYPSPGLERGNPAIRLRISTDRELTDAIEYIRAARKGLPLPSIQADVAPTAPGMHINPAVMPKATPVATRRAAIPRAIQREVWQRDGGKCVECETKERLCFDHIVPFSRGGSNTVRNLQLLCERCNGSKGNRL